MLSQLLPEAVGEIGIAALLVFGAALALPATLERLAHRRHGGAHHHGEHADDHALGLELGYLGLLLHNFGDGVGIGAYAGPLHEGRLLHDVTLSVAAHTVPVTALVVVAFASQRGSSSAVGRAIGLALATLAGAAVAGVVPPELAEPWEPWVTAAVAGLLLHVIAHDWPAGPRLGRRHRLLDMLAIAAGLCLILLGGHPHTGEPAGDARARLAHTLAAIALDSAPALLLGLLAGALVQSIATPAPARWLATGGLLRSAARGVALGARLPVCGRGVVSTAAALQARGAAPALLAAFLFSAPALGVESFALTGRLLGWPLALLRLGAAPLLAMAAAAVVGAARRPEAAPGAGAAGPSVAAAPAGWVGPGEAHPWPARLLAAFDELLHHTGAWMIVGAIAAAYVDVALPAGALAPLAEHGLDLIAVSLAALPSYVCAVAATPLAAVLIDKGLSPGAVLAGLLLGPATNLATATLLRRWAGTRAAATGIAALVGAAWLLAVALDASPLVPRTASFADAHAEGSTFAWAALVVLALLVARGLWRTGLRAWMEPIAESFSGESAVAGRPHDQGCTEHAAEHRTTPHGTSSHPARRGA